jgi:hypothetical protein
LFAVSDHVGVQSLWHHSRPRFNVLPRLRHTAGPSRSNYSSSRSAWNSESPGRPNPVVAGLRRIYRHNHGNCRALRKLVLHTDCVGFHTHRWRVACSRFDGQVSVFPTGCVSDKPGARAQLRTARCGEDVSEVWR